MATGINIDKQMQKILDEYALQVSDATRQAVKEVAQESVKKLKKTSPRRPKGGAYAKGWTYKLEAGTVDNSATVYGGKKTYPLAHLLEHGHLMRNGQRGGQRIHIKPVEGWAIAELERKITELVEGIK